MYGDMYKSLEAVRLGWDGCWLVGWYGGSLGGKRARDERQNETTEQRSPMNLREREAREQRGRGGRRRGEGRDGTGLDRLERL